MPNGVDALLKAVTVGGDTSPIAGAQRRLGAASAPPHKDRTKASAVWATSEGMLGAATPGVLARSSSNSSAMRRSKGAAGTAAEAAAFAAAAGRGAGSGGGDGTARSLRPWTAEGTEGAATGSGATDEHAVGAWGSVGSSGRGGGGREQPRPVTVPTPVLTGRRRSGSGGGSDRGSGGGSGGGSGPASGYGTGSGVGVGRHAGNADAGFSCGVPGREGGGFSGGGVLGGARPAAGLGLALAGSLVRTPSHSLAPLPHHRRAGWRARSLEPRLLTQRAAHGLRCISVALRRGRWRRRQQA